MLAQERLGLDFGAGGKVSSRGFLFVMLGEACQLCHCCDSTWISSAMARVFRVSDKLNWAMSVKFFSRYLLFQRFYSLAREYSVSLDYAACIDEMVAGR